MLDRMSFSRELVNDPSCINREQQKPQQPPPEQNEIEKSNMMDPKKNERKESLAAVFNSQDFGRYLSSEFPTGNLFLSKDNFLLPSFDNSVFKSKDSFSNLYASKDWEVKFPHEDLKLPTEELPPLKIMMPAPKTAQAVLPVTSTSRADVKAALSSKEWMPMSTLGDHVDVSYNPHMFGGSDSESDTNDVKETDLNAELPPAKTDWNSMFFQELQLLPPSPSILSERIHSISSVISAPGMDEEPLAPHEHFYPLSVASTALSVQAEPIQAEPVRADAVASAPEVVGGVNGVTSEPPKKKRKRRPRKKIVPEVKEYVEPTHLDVLLGRGGKSNHHPGNKRYREEVQNLQSWYLGVEDKNEKTDLSQCLVDYVHSYDGRFLYKDEIGWYVVPNIISRRKASQALREDNDAEKRAAKRARFLQKKELEAQRQQG